MKKFVMFVGAVVCTVGLSAGTAGAHYCTAEKRPDRANAKVAQHSKGWTTYDAMIDKYLCADGAAYLRSVMPASIPMHEPIHARVSLASGATHQGKHVPGIGEIGPDVPVEDWEAFDEAIDEAIAICSS